MLDNHQKPTADALLNLQKTLYTSTNPTRRWLHMSRRNWIDDTLAELANDGPNRRAMEVGPGCGVYLPVLCDLFENVTAVDIEDAYLAQAHTLTREHDNLTARRDDITHSMHPSNNFDLILCTEVVEHLKVSRPAFENMYRLLRPGGHLVLSTPQRYSPLELTAKIAFLPGIISLVRKIYGEPVLKTGHINLMTESQVIDQAESAGFRIERRFKSGLYLPLIAEFAGRRGLNLERWLEAILRDTALDGLLWTQYYVLSKPRYAITAQTPLAKAA